MSKPKILTDINKQLSEFLEGSLSGSTLTLDHKPTIGSLMYVDFDGTAFSDSRITVVHNEVSEEYTLVDSASMLPIEVPLYKHLVTLNPETHLISVYNAPRSLYSQLQKMGYTGMYQDLLDTINMLPTQSQLAEIKAHTVTYHTFTIPAGTQGYYAIPLNEVGVSDTNGIKVISIDSEDNLEFVAVYQYRYDINQVVLEFKDGITLTSDAVVTYALGKRYYSDDLPFVEFQILDSESPDDVITFNWNRVDAYINGEWVTYNPEDTITVADISLTEPSIRSLRLRYSTSTNIPASISNHRPIVKFNLTTGSCNLRGNLMWLTCSWSLGVPTNKQGYNFMYTFGYLESLVDASGLVLHPYKAYNYTNMFERCINLVKAPKLTATALSQDCYSGMFYNCTSLTQAPELPATTLANSCYQYMFYGCTSLTQAPELPATTLADYCYSGMFYGCTSLTRSVGLPATELVKECYAFMYGSCKNLKVIPTFHHVTSSDSSSTNLMFTGCSGLYPTNMYTTLYEYPSIIESDDIYGDGSGFFGVDDMLGIKGDNGYSYVQLASDVEFLDDSDSLTFECTIPFTVDHTIKGTSNEFKKVIYKVDNNDWVEAELGATLPEINPNHKYKVKAWTVNEGQSFTRTSGSHQFSFSASNSSIGNLEIKGNFNASIDCSRMFTAASTSKVGPEVFKETFLAGITVTPTNITAKLPATTLANNCYQGMFYGCTSLTTAPELPATTLANYCYYNMFRGCTNLTTAPKLPATTLVNRCYYWMFQGCTNLTTAPELPATILDVYCYSDMFYGCTSLTQAPELPATTLAQNCYSGMFLGCTSLTTAPRLPATTLVSSCYADMFRGCTSLTTAPELPATTLANYCYYQMFSGSGLKVLPTLHCFETSDTEGLKAFNGMFANILNLTLSLERSDTSYIPYTFTASNGGYLPLSICSVDDTITTATLVSGVTYYYGSKAAFDYVNLDTGVAFYTNDSEGYISFNITKITPAITGNPTVLKYHTPTMDHWLDVPTEGYNAYRIEIPANSSVIIRCENIKEYKEGALNLSDTIYKISGDLAALFFSDDLELRRLLDTPCGSTADSPYELDYLFQYNTALIDASGAYLDTVEYFSFKYTFQGCTSLIKAPKLPATTLANRCYQYMFSGCTSLTQAPELPATRLANYCYADMFRGCTSLTTAPELPATTLASGCYEYMFSGCTSLTQAPELPATTLADSCYYEMFYKCTSLTQAPELPATTLASGCYSHMFHNCTSLTQAPELPVTTLADYCYHYMFYKCTSLTQAPELPATTLADYCYQGMFLGCTSLTTAPSTLPATTLAKYCYSNMFRGCTSLIDASLIKISSTELSSTGISSMFKGCTNLESTPTFNLTVTTPASTSTVLNIGTELKGLFKGFTSLKTANITINTLPMYEFPSSAFQEMFSDCTNLATINGSINIGYMSGSYSNQFESMFFNCTSLMDASMITFSSEISGDYACQSMFECCTHLLVPPTFKEGITLNGEYSCSCMFQGCTSLRSIPFVGDVTLNGKDVCNSMFQDCRALTDASTCNTIIVDGYSACYGMFYNCTLLFTPPKALKSSTASCYEFTNMFYNCTALTTAPDMSKALTLHINDTTMGHQFDSMFYGCVSLINAPALNFTESETSTPEVPFYCCYSMFYGCTNLTSATINMLPETIVHSYGFYSMFENCETLQAVTDLPSTSIASTGAYARMFYYCSSLPTCPTIQATQLIDETSAYTISSSDSGAFSSMFYKCTSLTQAPELPVTTLAKYCYSQMFYNCTSLTQAPELPATTLANYCYQYMFYNCTSLTQAPELPATTLAYSCYYQMFYGCTSLTQAPELPATTLANYCYQGMFLGCTSLTTAPELPATTLAKYCYYQMFLGCTSLTTAPELPATTLATYCYYEMFYNCTSLTQAPELPATTLAQSCYSSMFLGCTSLTTAPELPATTLAISCYQGMFYNCTSLTQAPELPATTLAISCYYQMFYKCTSLKLSESTDDYPDTYRIPTSGEGVATTNSLTEMFGLTGGTFTGTPSINTIYYIAK